jgi:hypothetical protein
MSRGIKSDAIDNRRCEKWLRIGATWYGRQEKWLRFGATLKEKIKIFLPALYFLPSRDLPIEGVPFKAADEITPPISI